MTAACKWAAVILYVWNCFFLKETGMISSLYHPENWLYGIHFKASP